MVDSASNHAVPAAEPARFFRLLATADWQIGMIGGRLAPAAAEALRRARIDGIDTVLKLAADAGAQAVLAAGDLFEFASQPAATCGAVAAAMHRHPGVPIHAIPGNHDLYGPGTVWRSPELDGVKHLHVHHQDGEVALTDGVTLWPLPVRSKHDVNLQHDRLPDGTDRDGLHIVMAHGHDKAYLDLDRDGDHEDCKLPLDSRVVTQAGYHLLVLGHWHSFLQVGARTVYPGTHEQTRFHERDAGHVAVIDVPLDGGEPAVHKVSVGAMRWRRQDFDVTDKALPDDLVEHVRGLADEVDFLELKLIGDIDQSARIDALPRARAAIEPMALHHVGWSDETSERIDLEAALARYELPAGLREVQRGLLTDLVDAAGDADRGEALRAELQALFEMARDVGALDGEVAR